MTYHTATKDLPPTTALLLMRKLPFLSTENKIPTTNTVPKQSGDLPSRNLLDAVSVIASLAGEYITIARCHDCGKSAVLLAAHH